MKKKANLLEEWTEEQNLKQKIKAFLAEHPFYEYGIHKNAESKNFLLNINGVDCIPKGTLVSVSGKKGVGKSSLMAIFAGVLISGNEFACINRNIEVKKILWVDMEKSEDSCDYKLATTIRIANAPICESTLQKLGIDFLRLRGYTDDAHFLRGLLENLTETNAYDVIILDGIKPLAEDQKDNYDNAINFLYRLAEKGITVFGMLHTNKDKKDDNMMWGYGTAFSHAVETGFLLTKDDKTGILTVSNNYGNDIDMIPAFNLLYKNGILEPFVKEAKKKESGTDKAMNPDSRTMTNQNHIREILKDGVRLSRKKLMDELKKKGVSDSNAPKVVESMYKTYCLICKEEGRNGKYYLKV